MNPSTTEDEDTPVDPCGRIGLPLKVSRLRMKLSQKAKQEPKFRFYALYDRIYRMDVLQSAWKSVRKLGSAPGVDGIRFEDIESTEEGVEVFLKNIHEELRSKRYKPDAVRRVQIPKPDGRMRPLGIPTIRDRVAQMAVLLILEPIFEADFLDSSYGFRPGRNAHGALDAIRSHLREGKREVYDADLKGYFDTIPQEKLMAALSFRISDRTVLHLIRLWLECTIEETDQTGRKTRHKPTEGTPQGGVISPLLANIYLHWFEVLFYSRTGPGTWAKASIVRYADDFVVLARYQSERLRSWIETTLEGRFGLTINREKTKTVNLGPLVGDSLEFLGFTMRYERSILPHSERYLYVGPSRKALQRVREKLHEMTASRHCFKPATIIVSEVNRMLAGWGRYFGYGHPRRAFAQVNYYTFQRMRTHLRRRSQRGCRPSSGRTLYEHLYHQLGLQMLRGDHPSLLGRPTKRLR
ncbi:MAG: group II intron reverse transcriptase/maturase [Pirellula sp.]